MLGAFLHQFHSESPVSNTWYIMSFLCCIRRRLGCGRDSSAAARRPGTPDIDGGANFNGCGGSGAHTSCPSSEDSQHAAGSPLAPIKWLLRFYCFSGVIPGKKIASTKKTTELMRNGQHIGCFSRDNYGFSMHWYCNFIPFIVICILGNVSGFFGK